MARRGADAWAVEDQECVSWYAACFSERTMFHSDICVGVENRAVIDRMTVLPRHG